MLKDIRLTPADLETTKFHVKLTGDFNDDMYQLMILVANAATDKAITKMKDWGYREIGYLEYINEQLRNTVEGDEEYRRMMISGLNDLKINLKQL